MRSKQHDFFRYISTFPEQQNKSSLSSILKNKREDGIIEDQRQVAETLANYFSTIASDIGGSHVISLTEDEFNNTAVFK